MARKKGRKCPYGCPVCDVAPSMRTNPWRDCYDALGAWNRAQEREAERNAWNPYADEY